MKKRSVLFSLQQIGLNRAIVSRSTCFAPVSQPFKFHSASPSSSFKDPDEPPIAFTRIHSESTTCTYLMHSMQARHQGSTFLQIHFTHRSQQLPSAASVPSLSLSSILRADKSPEATPLINYSKLQRAEAPQGLKISSVFHIPLTGGRHPAASWHAWLLITRAQKTFYHQNVNVARIRGNAQKECHLCYEMEPWVSKGFFCKNFSDFLLGYFPTVRLLPVVR